MSFDRATAPQAKFAPVAIAAWGTEQGAGVKPAELEIARRAAAAGMRPAAYRNALCEQYRAWRRSPSRIRRPLSSAPAPKADSHFLAARAAQFPPHLGARRRTRLYAPVEK